MCDLYSHTNLHRHQEKNPLRKFLQKYSHSHPPLKIAYAREGAENSTRKIYALVEKSAIKTLKSKSINSTHRHQFDFHAALADRCSLRQCSQAAYVRAFTRRLEIPGTRFSVCALCESVCVCDPLRDLSQRALAFYFSILERISSAQRRREMGVEPRGRFVGGEY